MARVDWVVLLTHGLTASAAFPALGSCGAMQPEISFMQAVGDAWSSWMFRFVVRPS